MNNKKKQEIPLEAFDNELMHQEIIIPDDFKATIEGNKIILTKTENKDERIKNRLIKLIKMSSEVGGFALHKWEADEMLAWLEKQDTERKQLYVRFGDIPSNEKSKIYHGEEEIGDENGVSVYPAFELNGNIVLGLTLPITKTTLYTQQHLLEYDNRPCYLVSGDYVGKGTDGEPLIKNISVIKRLDNYRIKECEKKPAIEMKSAEESLGIDSETYNKIVDECIYGDDKHKSADKIELKFKVGDWVVSPNGVYWHIDAIQNGRYEVTTDTGQCSNWPLNTNIYRLWTIEDAKDGDVLAEEKIDDYFSPFVALYKKIDEECDFESYCFVGVYGKFYKGECGHSTNNIHPATKEQRDLLFQKMKEAGYEWDAEKKELKTVEKKPQRVVSAEAKEALYDKSTDNDMVEALRTEYEKGKTDAFVEMQKEWSEDDEKRIKNILSVLDVQVCWDGATGEKKNPYQKEIDWLKSLKNRYSWKPSDEQMDALNEKMLKTDEEMLNEEMINEEMLKNDEEMLKAAICLIKGVNNDTCHGGFACNGIHKDDVINWLEDLLACY